MNEKRAVCCIRKNCCCLKNYDQNQAKEISNPINFHSILKANSKTDLRKMKEKIIKNSKVPEFLKGTKMSKSFDYIYDHTKSDVVYQEIVGKKNNDLLKPIQNTPKLQSKHLLNHKKKKINLIYITNRILVANDDNIETDEFDKAIYSLKCFYGKHLKIFYLSIRSTLENPQKDLKNCLSTLPFLMPFICDIYCFLLNVHEWLLKSKKNIILLKSKENAYHLLEAIIRFLIVTDETNERLFKPESVILTSHEMNALLFYEKLHLEKYINPSLKRYIASVSSISFGLLRYHSNPKHLHVLIIKNLISNKKITNRKILNSEEILDDENMENKPQFIFITIYQNFHLIYTSYKIKFNEDIETDKIIFIIDPVLPINGDILIIANVTNKFGLKHIYFRVQFHTCWINGTSVIFKNSELDKSENYSSTNVELVELCFKMHPGIIKEHGNMLLSQKYSIADQNLFVKDIFGQLKLLTYSSKRNNFSYKIGPLDGNIYASIPKLKDSSDKKELSSNNIDHHLTASMEKPKDISIVLERFNKLENEISSAANLLSQNQKTCPKSLSLNLTQVYRKNIPNTSEENHFKQDIHIKSNDVDRKMKLIDYVNSHEIILDRSDKHKLPDNLHNKINISPYDNVNLKKTISDGLNSSYILEDENSSCFSNVKENIVGNHFQKENKYISNLNESVELKDSTGSISLYSKILSNDQPLDVENDILLYDNFPLKQPKTILNAMNTQYLWYKQHFTRQTAILYLLNKPVGYFIIRPSTSLWKSLSIALKYSTSIFNQLYTDSDSEKHIKHFIIDINTEGYRIRGFAIEKNYKTLAFLVQDHIENKFGLPCKLILPQEIYDDNENNILNSFSCDEKYISTSQSNDFQVIYLGSFILNNLFDNSAISIAIDKLQEKITSIPNFPCTKMTMRLMKDRVVFTDSKRKFFFRKNCKLSEIICCSVDPKRRVWKNLKGSSMALPVSNQHSPIFGILSYLQPNQGVSNQTFCQLFCTIDCNSEELCDVIKQMIVNVSN